MQNLSSSLVQSESTLYDLDLEAACLVAFCKKCHLDLSEILKEGNLLTILIIGSNVTLSSVKYGLAFNP